MANFFSREELAAQLQVDTIDNATADQYAAFASDALRAYLHQQVDRVRGDKAVLEATGSTMLVLPELPVTAVSGVKAGGVSLVTTDYEWWAGGQLYRLVYAGTADTPRIVGYWPYGTVVEVTYDHGYTTVPGAIKEVALELAANLYSNPGGVAQESVASYSVMWATRSSDTDQYGRMYLTAEQKLRLAPYRMLSY